MRDFSQRDWYVLSEVGMKKIALILAGCGHLDGAEITESVCLLIGLNQAGANVFCFAPDLDFSERNHLTREIEKNSSRNALKEAARIARGQVRGLSELHEKDFDALAFAGGMGVARNLCDWAEKQSQCKINPEVDRIIREFHSKNKPIGAVCIAPVLLAKVLGSERIEITLGNDEQTADEVRKTGAIPVPCPVTDYITDRTHKVVTTPAYMHGNALPHEIFQGISGLARELVEMA
jgi:enhancing lycopene biosynthesis protein 2